MSARPCDGERAAQMSRDCTFTFSYHLLPASRCIHVSAFATENVQHHNCMHASQTNLRSWSHVVVILVSYFTVYDISRVLSQDITSASTSISTNARTSHMHFRAQCPPFTTHRFHAIEYIYTSTYRNRGYSVWLLGSFQMRSGMLTIPAHILVRGGAIIFFRSLPTKHTRQREENGIAPQPTARKVVWVQRKRREMM